MNFEGLAGLYMLVSFNCDHCTAVLSIPEEQAGITGPCPFCGAVVTSPRRPPAAAVIPELRSAPASDDPPTSRDEPPKRVWREPQTVSLDEPALPFRPRRTGLKIAACAALFVGGVAGTWKIWHGDKPRATGQDSLSETQPASPPKPPRAAEVTEVSGLTENLPPPASTIPAAPPPAPSAVARNVSTASAPRTIVPATAEAPTLFPQTPASPVTSGVDNNNSAASPAPAQSGETADEKKIRAIMPTSAAVANPVNTLVKYFAAKTWQERLKFALAPERVKPLMEAYYKVHKDGPIIPEEIELMRMDPVGDDHSRHYFAFLVYFPGRFAGVPISVEETKNGCLVEWTSFTEGKDLLLEKFYSKYRKEEATFRILIRRGHYFEKDVPDQKAKIVFDINPPDRTGPYKLWLDKDSDTAKKFFRDDQLGWNQVLMMVVKLQWEKTPAGAEFVRLKEVVADSWHPEMLATK